MFEVGLRLTLETFQDEKNVNRYYSKVVEMTKKKLYIDYPTNEVTGKTALLLDDSQVEVSFVANDGNVYKYRTKILGRKKISGIHALVLNRPSNDQIIKIQRREYVRIDVSLDVALHPINKNNPPLITRTRDISGGGMAVFNNGKEDVYESGDLMEATIVLPFQSNDYSYINVHAKVIRCIQGDGSPYSGIITFKFTEINDYSRDQIIKYCFEKQREIRNKLHNTYYY